jgi:hypothetical protein
MYFFDRLRDWYLEQALLVVEILSQGKCHDTDVFNSIEQHNLLMTEFQIEISYGLESLFRKE